jgi:hypothetical protein
MRLGLDAGCIDWTDTDDDQTPSDELTDLLAWDIDQLVERA